MQGNRPLSISPFIGLCVVLLISLFLENVLNAYYPESSPGSLLHASSPDTVEEMGMESRHRLSYRTSCFLVLLIEVIVATFFWYIIQHNSNLIGPSHRAQVLRISLLYPAVLIGLVLVLNKTPLYFLSSELNKFFIPYPYMEATNSFDVEAIVDGISGLAIFFTFIMCGAYVAILYRSKIATKLEDFIAINDHVKWVLICGSLLLAVGVFNVRSLYNWALQYHLFSGPNPLATALAESASIQTGVVFSMIITILYLPAYFVVQYRLRVLVEKMKGENLIPAEKPVSEVLQEHQLGASNVEVFSRIVFLIAPALSGGPIQSILEL